VAKCDLTPFLRTKGLSRESRAYAAVVVQTARFVSKRRSSFNVHDVKLKRTGIRDIPPNVIRSWVGETLSSIERGPYPGNAMLPELLVRSACGKILQPKIKKYWRGF